MKLFNAISYSCIRSPVTCIKWWRTCKSRISFIYCSFIIYKVTSKIGCISSPSICRKCTFNASPHNIFTRIVDCGTAKKFAICVYSSPTLNILPTLVCHNTSIAIFFYAPNILVWFFLHKHFYNAWVCNIFAN